MNAIKIALGAGSAVEALNLLADHHWLFGLAAVIVAFVSSRRMRGRGVA